VAGNFTSLNNNAGNLDRLNQILDPRDKHYRRRGGKRFEKLRRQIELVDVSLRYSPDLPFALRNINLTILRGQTVALVGASGAGKSSIADLLVGLYEPTEGRILIDGLDISQIELGNWQRCLGVVSQNTFLFNATIGENIAFGTDSATPEMVAAAASMAQADGFIEKMPESYETIVGERGYRLSGGQRQRISLARAILRTPELLLLDEATSALDSHSERLVQ
jgi:ATP-binding cassette subfamily B protein/subfamily B ATP-binding cassette protein MsbA